MLTLIVVLRTFAYRGRYHHVASFFCAKGYHVIGCDHHAYGQSDGAPAPGAGCVHPYASDELLLEDLQSFVLDVVVPMHPRLPHCERRRPCPEYQFSYNSQTMCLSY